MLTLLTLWLGRTAPSPWRAASRSHSPRGEEGRGEGPARARLYIAWGGGEGCEEDQEPDLGLRPVRLLPTAWCQTLLV